MKILNFGSLNLDYVYRMHHFIRPGETAAAIDRTLVCGGKGLNQSIAIARSGAAVWHAGNIGREDGAPLRNMLISAGVNVDLLKEHYSPSGHTIIQVNDEGENAIIIYAGANGLADKTQIEETLACFDEGDLLVLQNEISCVPEIIEQAKAKGMLIAMNPSPIEGTETYPLHLLDFLFVNLDEAAHLGECTLAEAEQVLSERFPETKLIITRGAEGACFVDCSSGERIWQPAIKVNPVDTTAAGDTFMGYFLGQWANGGTLGQCMQMAAFASALSVTRHGAAPSIPTLEETLSFIKKYQG